jgi:hypothetical protein
MTDTRASRSHSNKASETYDNATEPSGWVGWVAFAGAMMIMLGTFQAIQGFVAIFDEGFYRVTERGLVVEVDFTVWGWTHLLLGVLIVAAGAGVLVGNLAARIVAVVLAAFSAIVNLLFIEAYPIWSIIIITVDVLVIFALIVHGRELKHSRT